MPYTGMIISTRESAGSARAGAASGHLADQRRLPAPRVGGYEEEERPHDSEQFDVSDQRTLDEVVHWLMRAGLYLRRFCTACYREGRTGDRFMSLCKSGQISGLLPAERPDDAGRVPGATTPKEETKKHGFALIERELEKIPKEKVREIARKILRTSRHPTAGISGF
ncbi:MAG: hypothetical protein ACLUD2_18525 [Clostridium sp.]